MSDTVVPKISAQFSSLPFGSSRTDRELDFSLDVDGRRFATDQARRIFHDELPDWADLFLGKNAQYAHLAESTLGDKAMFVDVWRKVNALRLVIWDGHEEAGTEPPDEIIRDLIGHLFLMLEYRHRGGDNSFA